MKTYFKKNYNFPVPKIRGKVVRFPTEASIKYDGEFSLLRVNRIISEVLNKPEYGRHRTNMPLTDEAQKKLIDKGYDEVVLAGELVSGEGKFMTFKKLDLHASFRCFAVVSFNGKDLSTLSKPDNKRVFEELGLSGDYLKEAQGKIIPDFEALRAYFYTITAQGYEGLVLKGLGSKALPDGETDLWTKVKRLFTADLAILGFTKEAKNLSLVLGLPNGQIITNCGNGFTLKQKFDLRKELAQKIVREDSKNYYVNPEKAVQINHQGIIYKKDNSISSVRMPIFFRFRDDKNIDECNLDLEYKMS